MSPLLRVLRFRCSCGSVWLNRKATTGTKSPPPLASGGFWKKDFLEEIRLCVPPRRALAQTTKRTGIEQMLVACRLAAVEMR